MKDQLGSEDYRDPNLYDYHYNREDRLSKLDPNMRARLSGDLPKGFFRKNRALGIILADILLIALVWFVLLPVIRTGANGRLEGYAFTLRGFSYGSNALVSLKVVKDRDQNGFPPDYTASFSLSSSDQTVEMQGALPKELKASTTLRTSLPLEKRTTAVVCTVTLGKRHLKLKAKLQTE